MEGTALAKRPLIIAHRGAAWEAPENTLGAFALAVIAGADMAELDVQVSADGRFAQVSGEVRLPAESIAATQVWVAAVGYDESGRVVGVRRWEGGGVQPGGSLSFEMTVSSLGGVLTRVEFAVEARP